MEGRQYSLFEDRPIVHKVDEFLRVNSDRTLYDVEYLELLALEPNMLPPIVSAKIYRAQCKRLHRIQRKQLNTHLFSAAHTTNSALFRTPVEIISVNLNNPLHQTNHITRIISYKTNH